MKQPLKHFPFHAFLFPFFFVLHTINEYFALIPFNIAGKFLLFYLLLSVALLAAGRFIFSSFSKAGFWMACILLVFYFFGIGQDMVKKIGPSSFFTSYTFILSLLFVFFILLTTWLKKSKNNFLKANLFLNFVFGIFVLIEVLLLLFYVFTDKEKEKSLSGNNIPAVKQLIPDNKDSMPDIFFIVFDEYASTESLKKFTGFDNSALDTLLLQRNFFISTHSKSNYNLTPVSVASTLNMAYFNKPLEKEKITAELLMRGDKEARFSQVPEVLENAGYTIKNYGQFNLHQHRVLTHEFYSDYPVKAISLQTLWGRLDRDILWSIKGFLRSDRAKDEMSRSADENIMNLQGIIKELMTTSDKPRFIYGHILLPHSPYVFDSAGHRLEKPVYHASGTTRDSLYINQLIYTNSWIQKITLPRKTGNNRPMVLIIEGDHGYRTKESNSRDQQFMNLNAYYFSDGDYSLLYDSISPVNTFRVVFKKYFNADIPLLNDSTVLLGSLGIH